jgi:hypothetical protein
MIPQAMAVDVATLRPVYEAREQLAADRRHSLQHRAAIRPSALDGAAAHRRDHQDRHAAMSPNRSAVAITAATLSTCVSATPSATPASPAARAGRAGRTAHAARSIVAAALEAMAARSLRARAA